MQLETHSDPNFDPTDIAAIEKKLEEIADPEGYLAQLAAGDAEYLRFLQAYEVAQLDAHVHPDRADVLERLDRARGEITAYEAIKFDSGPRP